MNHRKGDTEVKKKILVINDPIVCRSCPCFGVTAEDSHIFCEAARREFRDGSRAVIFNGDRFRPEWCPLKDLPDYKMDWSGGESYEAGWNDVLDLIGGRDD